MLWASQNFEGEREVHRLELLSHVLRVFQVKNNISNLFSFSRKPNSHSIRSLHCSFTELKTTKYAHFLEGVNNKFPFNKGV